MTYLTHRISNKRTESLPPNYDVWQWGLTVLSALHLPHIQHELHQSNHLRHADQSSICHPAPTEALLIKSCAEEQLQSQQGKCRYQSLAFRQRHAPVSQQKHICADLCSFNYPCHWARRVRWHTHLYVLDWGRTNQTHNCGGPSELTLIWLRSRLQVWEQRFQQQVYICFSSISKTCL